jgi:flagellar hook assembly protein FlgD
VSIYDENGNLIRTIELSGDNLAKGDHNNPMDGEDNNGSKVANGTYYFRCNDSNGSGASFSGDKFISGIYHRCAIKTDGTYVVINIQEVSLSKIIEIS